MDCIEGMKQYPDKYFDLAVVDPPYGLGIDGQKLNNTNKNPNLFPGQLTVHLDGVPRDSPYWIYDLGPVIDNQYEWAIVSDPVMLSLFVLARNVENFYEKYDSEVLSILTNYGFNDIVTVNHNNCEYAHLSYTSNLRHKNLRDYIQ
jgi:hypothetical protein